MPALRRPARPAAPVPRARPSLPRRRPRPPRAPGARGCERRTAAKGSSVLAAGERWRRCCYENMRGPCLKTLRGASYINRPFMALPGSKTGSFTCAWLRHGGVTPLKEPFVSGAGGTGRHRQPGGAEPRCRRTDRPSPTTPAPTRDGRKAGLGQVRGQQQWGRTGPAPSEPDGHRRCQAVPGQEHPMPALGHLSW